eukprot:6173297-Pleurochrysis_carterae.AAC.3
MPAASYPRASRIGKCRIQLAAASLGPGHHRRSEGQLPRSDREQSTNRAWPMLSPVQRQRTFRSHLIGRRGLRLFLRLGHHRLHEPSPAHTHSGEAAVRATEQRGCGDGGAGNRGVTRLQGQRMMLLQPPTCSTVRGSRAGQGRPRPTTYVCRYRHVKVQNGEDTESRRRSAAHRRWASTGWPLESSSSTLVVSSDASAPLTQCHCTLALARWADKMRVLKSFGCERSSCKGTDTKQDQHKEVILMRMRVPRENR